MTSNGTNIALRNNYPLVLEQLAKMCEPNPPTEGTALEAVNQCFEYLDRDERISQHAQAVFHHPLYSPTTRSLRLRALAKNEDAIKACGDATQVQIYKVQERALARLFFGGMTCFQRTNLCGEQEVCIRYARTSKKNENEWLDRTFGLGIWCTQPHEDAPQTEREFAFWTPDINQPRLFCWNIHKRSHPGDDSWYGPNTWTRLPMDGQWNLKTGFQKHRMLYCKNENDNVFKKFTHCTLGEMSQILSKLAQTTYQVYHSVENISRNCLADKNCAFFQINSEPKQYCVLDESKRRNNVSNIRILIEREGVWIERPFVRRESALQPYIYHISDGSVLDTTKMEFRTRSGKTFSCLEARTPTQDICSLGLQYDKSDWLLFRTITPAMLSRKESVKYIEEMCKTLINRSIFSSAVHNLVKEYLFIQAHTLPEPW